MDIEKLKILDAGIHWFLMVLLYFLAIYGFIGLWLTGLSFYLQYFGVNILELLLPRMVWIYFSFLFALPICIWAIIIVPNQVKEKIVVFSDFLDSFKKKRKAKRFYFKEV